MYAELTDLVGSIERDELIPCFQPIVQLRTGVLVGFEVLARWQHPEHGLILPENFIKLAEENGLIGGLTRQIFCKAFAAAVDMPKPLALAVNVSPVQLHYLSLPGQIAEMAQEAGFPLERLTVEITESALMHDLELVQKIARELKEMGCKLSLDDFGTGFSSLRHLQSLPFDHLKIDRSFVASMTNTRESRKIVAAIVGLGHSLGMSTVGEGIETEEQTDMLLWLGCEMGQGWLYGRPVLAEAIPGIVAAPAHVSSVPLHAPGDGWATSNLEALPTQRLAQLQAIYDGVPVGLCFLDRNLRYVSLNRRLAEMHGVSVESHMGRTVEEMAPNQYADVEPYLMRSLQGEALTDIEISTPASGPDTLEQTLLVSYQPAWDEADEVIGLSVAVIDVSALKRSEKAALESAEHYRHIVESTPQEAWILDPKGNNLEVSSQWSQRHESSKYAIRNLGWLEAVHGDDLEPVMRAMKQALRAGTPIDVEYRVRGLDGEWRWMRSRGSPRQGPAGEILRWYGSVEDIDDRKALENSLRESQEQLGALFNAMRLPPVTETRKRKHA